MAADGLRPALAAAGAGFAESADSTDSDWGRVSGVAMIDVPFVLLQVVQDAECPVRAQSSDAKCNPGLNEDVA
jgi:hypothetical protein